MRINITARELEFLKYYLFEENKILYQRLHESLKTWSSEKSLEISDELADAIRDWAGEKLQLSGFDKDYQPTKEGVILEELIDKLYV